MIDLEKTDRKNLHVDEVANLLGVSRRTVYYWMESGDLPSISVAGSRRVPVSVIKQLLPKDPPSPSLLSRFVQLAKHAR